MNDKDELAEAVRENMIRGYTQSIYAGWVSHDFSLLDDDEAVIREACRRIRRVARIAAEVLFEEAEEP